MTMTDSERARAAMRLIRFVTGEDYGDGMTVHDIGIGYAGGNPMSGMSDVWVLGNWNDRDRYEYRDARPAIPKLIRKRIMDNTPSRLFDALERLGVNGEWHDEWDPCSDCMKLVRTQPDSYCWTPQYILTDNGLICHDCAHDNAAEFVDEFFANESDRALTWLSEVELTALGWHDAFPDEHSAQHGWHPGQNDTPASVLAHWHETLSDDDETPDYVFIIVDKGQFDVSFRLYVRNNEGTEQE